MGESQCSDDVRSRSQSGFSEIKVFIRVSSSKRREEKRMEGKLCRAGLLPSGTLSVDLSLKGLLVHITVC
jgi:hypothetical protein